MKVLLLVVFLAASAWSFPQELGRFPRNRPQQHFHLILSFVLSDGLLAAGSSALEGNNEASAVANPEDKENDKAVDESDEQSFPFSFDLSEGLSESNNDIAESSEGALGDGLLSVLAAVLLPFLGSLQELLINLVDALVGGLISSLKTLLEELINPPVEV